MSPTSLSMPALGCEFVENGQALCALQYFGGTSGGPNAMTTYIVWMNRNQDRRMQLVLAAAMTAILQLSGQ